MGTTVKKLDDPAEFGAIPSGLTKASQLKKHERERYSVWYGHFQPDTPKDELGWVAAQWEAVLRYIRATYKEPEYRPNTLRSHLEGLANVLLGIDKGRFKEVVRPLFNTGLKIQRGLDEEADESKLTEADLANFVPYDELVAARDRLYGEWKREPANLKLNMQHLMLALNTYIPPLRLDWVDMAIWSPAGGPQNAAAPSKFLTSLLGPRSKESEGKAREVKEPPKEGPPKEAGEPPADSKNYLWEYGPGKWAVVINQDKIEAKRQKRRLPRQIMRLEDEIEGVTNGSRLNGLIGESLGAFPRPHVLIGLRSQGAMTPSSYNSALAAIFKPKRPHQNLIRKAYINHWHRARVGGHELSEAKLKAIAERMRHTLQVARGRYRKVDVAAAGPPSLGLGVGGTAPSVNVTPATLGPNTSKVAMAGGPPANQVRVTEVTLTWKAPIPVLAPRKYFNPAEYAKEYRRQHAEEIAVKKALYYKENRDRVLRDKIVRQLNRGLVGKPTDKSIDEYSLRLDEETGRWR